MRMKLHFELKNCNLDLDYRRMLLSFIKKSLQENDKELYQELYEGVNKKKQFTFAVQLGKTVYKEDMVELGEPKFAVRISTGDAALFISLYNAFLKQKNKEFRTKFDNSIKLTKIYLENEVKINASEIFIFFASPLVVREHIKESNKDYYYVYSDAKFLDCLKTVIKNDIKDHEIITKEMVENMIIEPLLGKFVLVKAFKSRIPASLGRFRLKGDVRLLKYLFDNGLGSRRSESFGMMDII